MTAATGTCERVAVGILRYMRPSKVMAVVLFAALATPLVTGQATAAPPVTVDVPVDEASDRIARSRDRVASVPAVGVGTSPAGSPNTVSYPQTVETYTDPWFDAYWARGDIIEYGMGMYANGFTSVGVTVAQYESPYSINWKWGTTGILWDIDVNGDLVSDYYAILRTLPVLSAGR